MYQLDGHERMRRFSSCQQVDSELPTVGPHQSLCTREKACDYTNSRKINLIFRRNWRFWTQYSALISASLTRAKLFQLDVPKTLPCLHVTATWTTMGCDWPGNTVAQAVPPTWGTVAVPNHAHRQFHTFTRKSSQHYADLQKHLRKHIQVQSSSPGTVLAFTWEFPHIPMLCGRTFLICSRDILGGFYE